MALAFAVTNYSGGPKFRFVGINNFLTLLADTVFQKSLGVTALFTVYAVVFQLALGLLFALLLKERFFGRNFYRSVFFVPSILSSVALGLAFITILNPTQGLMNAALKFLHLPISTWLAGADTALPTLIFITVWQNFGYYMIIFLGGLLSIDPSLYEAAKIDGAGFFTHFVRITLPGLTPVFFFAVTIAVINAFKVFDLVFVMTGGQNGGGPAGATNVLVFDIYARGFGSTFFGQASAESVMLLILVLGITVFQQHFQKRWVSYDAV
jgi:multiple sugar transport system permease protein